MNDAPPETPAGTAGAGGRRRATARAVLGAAGRALRPIRTFLFSALFLVPAHVVVVGGALLAAGALLGRTLPEGGAGSTVGAWSLALLYAGVGMAAGALAGLAAAAALAVDRLEEGVRERVMGLPADEGARVVPALPLAELRGRYEAILDAMLEGMLGRLRVPRLVRRLLRRGLRQAMVEEFLAHCEARGIVTVGFAELRNWAIAAGLPHALAPLRGQIRAWRVVFLGVPAGLFLLALLMVALVGTAAPATIVVGFFAAAGVAVAAIGLPRAGRHRRPWRWRLGVLVVGSAIAGWPWVYVRLWPHDLGLAWIVVLAATVWTLMWGTTQALVEADGPSL